MEPNPSSLQSTTQFQTLYVCFIPFNLRPVATQYPNHSYIVHAY